MQSLYEHHKQWVPTFIRDISFSGLSSASRCEGLNSFFDKYVLAEASFKDFVRQYKLVLEDRYEEEAKANFNAWQETPELKSPSPFEKQMCLVCTHEISKKFQVEVLEAAACHLKKEKEDGSSITYAVKDFKNNEDFMVEWNEQKSETCCSCHSFEYRGYLCRHTIVVLQMSGVSTIPFKYILQRWTNAATSRHSICDRLDEVQSKVRRYNDLCRRAIIWGEEGSLSQESYNVAVGAIKDALRQCASVNKSTNNLRTGTYKSTNNLRTGTSATLAIQGAEGANQVNIVMDVEEVSGSIPTQTNKSSKRAHSGKERESEVSNFNKKGKDMPGGLECPTLYPRFLTMLLRGGDMSKRSVEMLGEMLEEQS